MKHSSVLACLMLTACSGNGATHLPEVGLPDAGSSNTGGKPIANDAGVNDTLDSSVKDTLDSSVEDANIAIDAASSTTEDASEQDAATLPVFISYVPNAIVSTLAGGSAEGTTDGIGNNASFSNPTGIALDASGDLIVADYDSNCVRMITPDGTVSTILSGTMLVFPFGVAVANGEFYIQTDANEFGTKSPTSGTIWSFSLVNGAATNPIVFAQGMGRPRGITPFGNGLLVCDKTEAIVEQVNSSTEQITTLAGMQGGAGYSDGANADAHFNLPEGAAVMSDGVSVLIADAANNRIRVYRNGVVSTYAGNGMPTLFDGTCAAASFKSPGSIAIDNNDNVYVSDIGNHVVRRIDASCNVQTLAGDMIQGFADGEGSAAEFYGQEGIAVDPDGGKVYLTDGNGGDGSAFNRVRTISIAGH